MITVDFIIANQDRHNTNYGFIRNAETLEWSGLSPNFDCGASLWYDTVEVGSEVECMPFQPTHDGQIKLVDDFSWLDLRCLNEIDCLIVGMFYDCPTIDEARAKAIASAVRERVNIVEQLSRGKSLHEIKGYSRRISRYYLPSTNESILVQLNENIKITEDKNNAYAQKKSYDREL